MKNDNIPLRYIFPMAGLLIALFMYMAAACSTEESPTSAKSSDIGTETPTPIAEQPKSAANVRPFEGVELNIVAFRGPGLEEPLRRRGPEFTALTGAKVNVLTVLFESLYESVLEEFGSEDSKYDMVLFNPQWLPDLVARGYLEDLTDRIAATPELQWDDIAPFFRDFSATHNGRIYSVPLDGDFQMVFYRIDHLDAAGLKPPQTWDEYLTIAKALHGRDLNGDGEPDYGSCISKLPGAQAFSMFYAIATAFLQSEGTKQGAFFDIETMEPLVANEAFAAALEVYKATGQYGPPDERTHNVGDSRTLFAEGRCALSVDWGDVATQATAPDSDIREQVGSVLLPGSKRVLDRKTGKLVPCDKMRCPYAIDGINYAPYAAVGGWSGGIYAKASPKVKDAAFAFFSYLSQPAQANHDVTRSKSGFNPYRRSQFTDRDIWLKSGMNEMVADLYLSAIGLSMSSPNMVLDLRIPDNHLYQQVELDRALAAYLAGEMNREETMAAITAGWNRITEARGRDAQREQYRTGLGWAK